MVAKSSVRSNTLEIPKSPSFTTPPLPKKMFCVFKSRCITRMAWMWSNANAICAVQSKTWRSGKYRLGFDSRARLMCVNRSPSSAYAVTMHRQSPPRRRRRRLALLRFPSRLTSTSSSSSSSSSGEDKKLSLYAMTFGCLIFDRSCASASASPRAATSCTGMRFAT